MTDGEYCPIEGYDEFNVQEVRDCVGDISDPTTLADLRAYEEATKDRKTAAAAIDDRLDEVPEPETYVADDPPDVGHLTDDGDAEPDTDADVSEQDTAQPEGHRTMPVSAGDTPTVVVRNPDKTVKRLPDLPGSLDPGETRRYPESDILKKYIAQGDLQVVTTR